MNSFVQRRLFRYSLRGLFALTSLCAVAVWVYREYHVPPLDQITGLHVESNTGQTVELLFDGDVTPRTSRQLLGNLSDGSTLWFYDSQMEPLSDPGVFVTITQHNGEYFVRFSNHGWSTNWVSVPRDQLIKYIWACRLDNQTGSKRFDRSRGMRLKFDAHPKLRVAPASENDVRQHILSRIES